MISLKCLIKTQTFDILKELLSLLNIHAIQFQARTELSVQLANDYSPYTISGT